MKANKIKIEIKSRLSGNVLFEYEAEDNTITKTMETAINSNVDLRNVDLRNADLRNTNLSNADLRGARLICANLSGADLRNTNLSNADLIGADLSDANLSGAYLIGAYLSWANLRGADLSDANLSGAYLRGAYLSWANLRGADLSGANLRGAYLRGAYLSDANLSGADLRNTNIRNVDLINANLSNADLRNTNLSGANLSGADVNSVHFVPLACPSDGAFVGWKKVRNDVSTYLVKLSITEDSKRSSATRTKCRCDKAVVLAIFDMRNNMAEVKRCVNHAFDQETEYIVGEVVTADKWDENRWNECSNGIHFFVNKEEALNY